MRNFTARSIMIVTGDKYFKILFFRVMMNPSKYGVRHEAEFRIVSSSSIERIEKFINQNNNERQYVSLKHGLIVNSFSFSDLIHYKGFLIRPDEYKRLLEYKPDTRAPSKADLRDEMERWNKSAENVTQIARGIQNANNNH